VVAVGSAHLDDAAVVARGAAARTRSLVVPAAAPATGAVRRTGASLAALAGGTGLRYMEVAPITDGAAALRDMEAAEVAERRARAAATATTAAAAAAIVGKPRVS